MTIEPLAVNSPELIQAMERNLAACWTTLRGAPGVTLHESAEAVACVTGLPFPVLNSVFCANLPDDAAIDRVLQPFGTLPMVWWIGPIDRPADLGERLAKRGLVGPDQTPGMAVDLSGLGVEPLPPGFTISRPHTKEDWLDWSRVVNHSFGMGDTAIDAFAAMISHGVKQGGGQIAAFLGRLDGVAIGASYAVLSDGLAGVFCVGTLEAARGKGIGRAMTLAACLYAKARGYKTGVLQASKMGHPVYSRMGFTDVCQFSIYARVPA